MNRSPVGDDQVRIRRATRRDLDALVALEQGFPGDRMTRAGISRLLTRDSAEIWVAQIGQAVVGDAVVLFRHGFDSARLYSMVVDPRYRGRGVAKMLLDAAEGGARERGVVVMRLEVREENSAALALYQQAGYTVRGRTDDYYQDHAAAIRLYKRFVDGGATVRGVPYHPQSLSFTSGSACLMMAMRYHGYPVPLDEWLELTLWREATSTFRMQDDGGLSAHGLAVAALRRGFHARLITPDPSASLADEEGDSEAHEVARTAHAGFEREMRSLGGKVEVRDFDHEDAVAALENGALGLALLVGFGSANGSAATAGRWVVITGFDANHLYLHDPLLPEGAGRNDNVHLALKRPKFDSASQGARSGLRALVLIERWGSVSHRSPDS